VPLPCSLCEARNGPERHFGHQTVLTRWRRPEKGVLDASMRRILLDTVFLEKTAADIAPISTAAFLAPQSPMRL
jgi:hypothetical protein